MNEQQQRANDLAFKVRDLAVKSLYDGNLNQFTLGHYLGQLAALQAYMGADKETVEKLSKNVLNCFRCVIEMEKCKNPNGAL